MTDHPGVFIARARVCVFVCVKAGLALTIQSPLARCHTTATADATDGVAIGHGANVEHDLSTAVGAFSSAQGEPSAAFGYYANADGRNTTALGPYATATHLNAVAIGAGVTTKGNNRFYMAPLREATLGCPMFYDTGNYEVVYDCSGRRLSEAEDEAGAYEAKVAALEARILKGLEEKIEALLR